MTREQKIKLIELIQKYFRDFCDPEDIEKYGYTMPLFEISDMFSRVLFGKHRTDCAGFNRTVHKHIWKCNLTEDERKVINDEFIKISQTGALTLTKSRKAVRVSEKVMWYNNILY